MIGISQPQIGKEEVKAVEEVLLSGRLAQGAKVEEFEERFAAHVGADYGVAVGNGTQALHLALLARGVRFGELVVTTPFTFAATATAIRMCGAEPFFVDTDENGLISTSRLTATRLEVGAVQSLPVHLYGNPTPIDVDLDEKTFIFDACQAHGAALGGIPVGFLGTSCWSFYATKNMTTGEGGMITTNDEGEADLLRGLRNHGQSGQYTYIHLGYNYRMTEMQAAIGLVQLDKLPTFQAKRQYNAAYLSNGLANLPDIILPEAREGTTHAWHQYTIRVRLPGDPSPGCDPRLQPLISPRDSLLMWLRSNDVGAKVYYPLPLHKTPIFSTLRYGGDYHLPMAETLAKEVLSLPVHPGLSDHDLDKIISLVRSGRQRQPKTRGQK